MLVLSFFSCSVRDRKAILFKNADFYSIFEYNHDIYNEFKKNLGEDFIVDEIYINEFQQIPEIFSGNNDLLENNLFFAEPFYLPFFTVNPEKNNFVNCKVISYQFDGNKLINGDIPLFVFSYYESVFYEQLNEIIKKEVVRRKITNVFLLYHINNRLSSEFSKLLKEFSKLVKIDDDKNATEEKEINIERKNVYSNVNIVYQEFSNYNLNIVKSFFSKNSEEAKNNLFILFAFDNNKIAEEMYAQSIDAKNNYTIEVFTEYGTIFPFIDAKVEINQKDVIRSGFKSDLFRDFTIDTTDDSIINNQKNGIYYNYDEENLLIYKKYRKNRKQWLDEEEKKR